MDKLKSQAEGYDFRTTENGEREAVSQRTGEITAVSTVEVPAGSYVITPDQQRARREEIERKRGRSKENFYYVPTTEDFKDIPPADAARMVYLCTFLSYDDGRLMLTNRTSMKRGDLEKTLGLSHAETWRFWETVISAGYLSEDDMGNLFPNKEKFWRGKIKNNERYVRIYFKGVRSLYKSVSVNQHKLVGTLFSLLPYVNIEFNILCFNPEEKDFDSVELMTLRQFCEAIHYDVKGLKRKLRDMRKLGFDVDGHKERFYYVANDGIDIEGSHLFVNPNILYAGSNYESVRSYVRHCELSN